MTGDGAGGVALVPEGETPGQGSWQAFDSPLPATPASGALERKAKGVNPAACAGIDEGQVVDPKRAARNAPTGRWQGRLRDDGQPPKTRRPLPSTRPGRGKRPVAAPLIRTQPTGYANALNCGRLCKTAMRIPDAVAGNAALGVRFR